MKKFLPFVLLAALFFSVSCRFPSEVLSGVEGNPFLKATVIPMEGITTTATDSFSFFYFTDAHINRERNTSKKIIRFDEKMFAAVKKGINDGTFLFAVSGGDISDDGEVDQAIFDFTDKFYSAKEKLGAERNLFLLQCAGNHDRHLYDYRSERFGYIQHEVLGWNNYVETYVDNLYQKGQTTGRFVYRVGDTDILSIYVLDASFRTYSSKQLDYLEEALKEDKSLYRLAFSHDNIITGATLDQSLVMTGYADLAEMTRYLQILEEGRVSLVITGHHHKGNILYTGSGTPEFNGAAVHRVEGSIFESDGWWYTVTINPMTKKLTVDCYYAETGEKRDTKVLDLR